MDQLRTEDSQAFAIGVGGVFGDFEFPIKGQQLEVSLCHLADDGNHYIAPRFLARQKLCAGRFVETADAAEVYL